MKLIVGLGNPGEQYDKTRHNIGFQLIDAVAQKLGITLNKHDFEAQYFINQDFILVKPLTYMNLSGHSVVRFAHYYKVAPQDILIIRDDLDTPLGQAKIKLSGGSGGHNGMQNINKEMNSFELVQMKIGIGRPENKHIGIAQYVLSPFLTSEQVILDAVKAKAVDAIISCIYNGFRTVMNNFNQKGRR